MSDDVGTITNISDFWFDEQTTNLDNNLLRQDLVDFKEREDQVIKDGFIVFV